MSRFTDAEYESAIEDMMTKPGIVSRFITDGESNDNLDRVALLLLSRDLPRMDKSERDDRLRLQYEAVREAMLSDFIAYVHRVHGFHRGSGGYSLVDAYILNSQDEARLETAA